MSKLKAIDVIEIDEEFLDEVAAKLQERKPKSVNSRLYTIKDVSGLTGLGKLTTWKHVKSGLLKANKIGSKWMINQEQLDEYLKQKGK